MTERGRSAVQAVLIGAALAVTVLSALAFRSQDWPIYVVFVVLWFVLNPLAVEVLPHLPLPVANLATVIGFLYIGGAPIIEVSGRLWPVEQIAARILKL